MIPRIISRLIMGRAPEARRLKRPPLPVWVLEPGATHPAQGGFVAVDDTPAAPAPVVTVEAVDASAAQLLAEEAQRLTVRR